MTDIQNVEAKVAVITPETAINDIADAYFTLAGMAQRIKELQTELDLRIAEKVKDSGEFTIGEWMWTLIKPKTVKCRDVAATTSKLLEITGGDLDKINACLAAGAWKPGAVKRVLEECGAPGETWDVLFDTTYDEKVKVTKVNLAFASK